jgi:molybdopterin synthase catalytic subunit
MFFITSQPIDDRLKLELLGKPPSDCGALVSFEGMVRDHNEGKAVASLEYECYREMAEKVGQDILRQALKLFPIKAAFCIHREGHLQIGEPAVWVGVYAPHREEAFRACRFIIDEVKLHVPIWKKEHYVDLSSDWVACHQCAHSHKEHHHHD